MYIKLSEHDVKADGISDDSAIINSLISENTIIDLENKVYKCNKTIDIKYNNVIIQNGILDFKDIEKNEPFYSEINTDWTTACGIRILGSSENPVPLTYGTYAQSDYCNDFVRIDNKNNIFNNDDFIFINSDKILSENGGGGTSDGLKNGEIIQIETVNEKQWVKSSNKLCEESTSETQLNFINSTFENYLVEDNAKISKLNMISNITLRNLTLKSKELSSEELNNPDRFRAHRTEWRNEKGLYGNEYLGTAIWIQYGYNITIEKCKIFNWYDTGIALVRSFICNIDSLLCNHIYANGKGYGINIRDASQQINISNSSFTDQRHPISIGGLDGINRNIKITKNSIHKSRDAGIDSHTAGQFLYIDNNHIICEGSDNEQDGIIVQGFDSIITNNTIDGFIRYGISINPSFYFENIIPSFIINNNIINGKNIYGISFRGNNYSLINNISISNNTINKSSRASIMIYDDNKILSSTIINNYTNSFSVGITLYNTNNITINTNTINSEKQNVLIRLCENVKVMNNTFNNKNNCLFAINTNCINIINNIIIYDDVQHIIICNIRIINNKKQFENFKSIKTKCSQGLGWLLIYRCCVCSSGAQVYLRFLVVKCQRKS